VVRNRGGGADTIFVAKAKESRTRLKIRANINANTVIMISQAFKRKIV